MKKKILSILLSAVLLCSFAACSNGTSNSGGVASPDSTSGDAASGSASGQADGEPKYGGVMRYASHLTIANPGYTPECTISGNLLFLTVSYESLTYYDESGKLIPKLATEWSTDANEPSITWTLRQGVKFADGTDFNADAVKVNIEEYQKFSRSETSNIASCEVVDDHTIKMHLKEWNSSTLESVGFFVYYMSPKAMEDVDSLRASSCGTGAFQVSEFEPGIAVKYEKNENYWQPGKPYLDGVEIYVVEEPTTRASAFQAGEYDIISMNSTIISKQLKDSGQHIFEENKSGVGLVATGLIPRSSDVGTPFADVRVRQAMCYALDTEALCNTFGYGLQTILNQWAVPGTVTYNPDVKGYPYDLEKAKALLADAGYPDGFDTIINTNAGGKDLFTAAANMLADAGIRCEINLIDETAQVNLYSTGTWQGIMGHFFTLAPDLGLYMGRHLAKDAPFYAAGIQHPDNAMALLEAVQKAPTEAEKIKLEHELQALVYDDLALFGQPISVGMGSTWKYDYVVGDDREVRHTFTWAPENAWLSK